MIFNFYLFDIQIKLKFLIYCIIHYVKVKSIKDGKKMTDYTIEVSSSMYSPQQGIFQPKICGCKEVHVPNTSYSKLVTRENEVAILISPNYGSGWYTANARHGDQLIKDSRIIRYKFDFAYRSQFSSLGDFFRQELGITKAYLKSFDNLVVKFIPSNTIFRIVEYDGAESIEIYNPDMYMTA